MTGLQSIGNNRQRKLDNPLAVAGSSTQISDIICCEDRTDVNVYAPFWRVKTPNRSGYGKREARVMDQIAGMQRRIVLGEIGRGRAKEPGKRPDNLLDDVRIGHLIHPDRNVKSFHSWITTSVRSDDIQLDERILDAVGG